MHGSSIEWQVVIQSDISVIVECILAVSAWLAAFLGSVNFHPPHQRPRNFSPRRQITPLPASVAANLIPANFESKRREMLVRVPSVANVDLFWLGGTAL